MTTWAEITHPRGEYVSEVFDVSNSLDTYVTVVDITKINVNRQQLDIFFSLSADGEAWGEWHFLEEGSEPFKGQDIERLYFRYKVSISSTNETEKPYLQAISVTLFPYTLLRNVGDLPIYPKIWIRKTVEDGDIELVNHFDGQRIILENLKKGEELFLDCANEELISSLQEILNIYRFDDHNDEWLKLSRGENYIRGKGNFDIDFRFQNTLLQE